MKFVAFERSKQGTGASRRLRNSGRAPGIVYGAGEPPLMIELDHNALWHALRKEAFHSSILDMEVAGKTSKVLLRDVQYHPFRPLVLHVDFQRVNVKEKLRLKVPLHFVGEAESPAVKMDRCLMNYVLAELEVHCLPADLPEFIEVDVSKLEKGAIVRLSDVVLPKGVEIVTHGQEDQVLLSVVAPGGAEEESTAEGTEAAAAAPAPSAAEDKK